MDGTTPEAKVKEAARQHFLEGKRLWDDPKRAQDVRTCLQRALALAPHHPRALQMMAMLLWREGKAAEAEEYLRKAIQLKPSECTFHSCLGLVRKALSASDREVEGHFRRSIELASGDCCGVLVTAADYLLGKPESMEEGMALLHKASAMQPQCAGIKYKLGKAYHKMGRLHGAQDALEQAVRLEPGGYDRAAFWLAVVRLQLGEAVEVPAAAPQDYVARLFDGYASKFDQHLVEALGYRTPRLLMEAVVACLPASLIPFESAVDAGCGTGLSAIPLKPLVRGRPLSSRLWCVDALCADSEAMIIYDVALMISAAGELVGIDLSRNMLSKARERDMYKDLIEGEVVECLMKLGDAGRRFEITVLCDVVVYLGDLHPLMRAISSVGSTYVAMSTEALIDDDGWGYALQPTGRYKHSRGYLKKLAAETGYTMMHMSEAMIRQQAGKDLLGLLVVLQANPDVAQHIEQ